MSSDLKNKMDQWEAQLPESAWNRITASLDADDEYVLAQKLSSFESQPPRQVWEHIEAGLEEQQPARVVPFYQKHKIAFQYGSVAAVFIFVAVLISLFVSKPSASDKLTERSSMQTISQVRKAQAPADHTNMGASAHVYPESQSNSDLKSSIEDRGTTAGLSQKYSFKDFRQPKKGNSYHSVIGAWQKAKDSLENRYFVHTNNRGEAIRYSSKLYDLFECSDVWTETECAQQIKLWQQKAATSAIYASADFTGVLEILRSMEERER